MMCLPLTFRVPGESVPFHLALVDVAAAVRCVNSSVVEDSESCCSLWTVSMPPSEALEHLLIL